MRTTQQMRDLWGHNHKLVPFKFWTGVAVTIDSRMTEAFAALDSILKAWNYGPKLDQTWGHFDRKITGGSALSLHAYGIAVDINSLANRYGKTFVTDMPFEMREQIERIRTKSGARVWRWGGDWNDDHQRNDSNYDAMHFECQASPAELAAGVVAPYTAAAPLKEDKPMTPEERQAFDVLAAQVAKIAAPGFTNEVVQDVVMHPDASGRGYLLDHLGGLHVLHPQTGPGASLPRLPRPNDETPPAPYFQDGQTPCREVRVTRWPTDEDNSVSGYTVDFRGGMHHWGPATVIVDGPYW